MYIPEPYRIKDVSEAISHIRNNPFGLLITQNSEVADTTHLPVMISENGERNLLLSGHMAAANQQSEVRSGSPCKMIFTGPHSYISPEWYIEKDVPTWNYISVEAEGHLRWLRDEESFEMIGNQMRMHEGIDSMNMDTETMVRALMSRIRCFEIIVDSLEMCNKMSQKKSTEEVRSIVKGLRSTGDAMSIRVARIMEDLSLKDR